VVLALLAAFTLLLSGCFRPAGDTIQPTSDLSGDTSVLPLDNAASATVAPAVTLLSPNTSAATATQALPALTQVTLSPATATPFPADTSADATATLQIITPGISLGLLTPDTPIPAPTELPSPGVSEETAAVDMSGAESGLPTTEPLVSGEECTYTIEPGDSLYLIAIRNDTTVAALQEVNPDLTGAAPILQIGQVIRLSDCVPGGESVVEETDPVEVPDEAEVIGTALPAGAQTYRVQPGDTLGAIATRFGVTVRAITEANSISNPNALSIGQELIIPAPASS
jgi:LysM repeat protein